VSQHFWIKTGDSAIFKDRRDNLVYVVCGFSGDFNSELRVFLSHEGQKIGPFREKDLTFGPPE